MPIAAPVQEARPSKPGPSPLTPEARERILFARLMILLIVPLYVLILLTLKSDVRHRIEHVCATFGLDAEKYVEYGRSAYHGLIVLACAVPPLYSLLGVARLALGRAGRRHVLAGAICVVVGIGEAVAIALVVYRFKVSL